MAFNSTDPRAEYTASSGQTVFPFLFKIFTGTDIKVYQNDTELTLTTHFTVTIDGDNGGEITLVTGATTDDSIVLVRELPVSRDIEYQTSGDLLADTLNDDQEYQTYLIQDRESTLGKAVLLPQSETTISNQLPATQAGYALYVNNSGTAFEYRVADEQGAALKAWESEAEALTSESYAVEPEDTFVNIWTSDGDGTFTATPTTDYSALHWAAKTGPFLLLSGGTLTGQVKGITPIAIDDLTRKDYVDGITTGLTSGTYTPTVSNIVNVDTTVVRLAMYTRIGDLVTVSGSISINATIDATLTEFEISLPVASPFVSVYDAVGSGTFYNTMDATIFGVVGVSRVKFQYISTSAVVETHVYFSFTYRVL